MNNTFKQCLPITSVAQPIIEKTHSNKNNAVKSKKSTAKRPTHLAEKTKPSETSVTPPKPPTATAKEHKTSVTPPPPPTPPAEEHTASVTPFQELPSEQAPTASQLPGTLENTAIADTGCTSHFFMCSAPLLNKRATNNPIAISNPNGDIMYSSHEAELDILGLPLAARQVHIVPALASHSLMSMGQLCDAGCEVVFSKRKVTVLLNDQTILIGRRDKRTKLWHIKIQQKPLLPVSTANSATALAAIGAATPADLVTFAHASLGFPAISTLEKALQKGYINHFPGLTLETLRRHPPTHSIPMHKGHLDQQRKGLRSTKAPPTDNTPTDEELNEISDTLFPPQAGSVHEDHHCFLTLVNPTGQIAMDPTGRFLTPSVAGDNYIMVCYDYDGNGIWFAPLKTRSAVHLRDAFKSIHERICAKGLRPKFLRLDNECSELMKELLREVKIDYQCVPPSNHRRNAAERAVRTAKNHLIAILSGTDADFPLNLWHELLPQAEQTLNMLRGSRINPNLSAWSQVNGEYDFNRTPIAPLGIRVLAFEPSDKRDTWSPHGLDGWYVGPALDSYRCYRVWITETRALRTTDTIVWFPRYLKMPIASTMDLILAGVKDIRQALLNPSQGSPLSPITDSHVEALRTLTDILSGACRPSDETTETRTPAPEAAPELRVLTPEIAPKMRVPATETAPEMRVTASTKRMPPLLSFAELTGPTGKRNRRLQRIAKAIDEPTKSASEKAPLPAHTSLRKQRQLLNRKLKQHLDDTVRPSDCIAAKDSKHGNIPAPSNHQHFTRSRHFVPFAAGLAEDSLLESPSQFAYHGTAINPDTGGIAGYRELTKCSDGKLWEVSMTDEFGRLCKGHATMPTGTDTMRFITADSVPSHKNVTYPRIVCADRPEKTESRRVRITVGGDRLEYDGDVSTKAADLTTTKVVFNHIISSPGWRFMSLDIKNFYLNTPMEEKDYEYMKFPVAMIPMAIIDHYKLKDLVHNGFVYVQIRKGMYGLKQAGRIAHDQLVEHLAPHGYAPVPITHGLWKHKDRDLVFPLIVDDVGVGFKDKRDAEHLIAALESKYVISTDWTGSRFCGMNIDWDYDNRTCDISLPGYIDRALQRFEHPAPKRKQHSPHLWLKPTYGKAQQYAPEPDDSEPLNKTATTRLQAIVGTLLYYARCVDASMLPALGDISAQQAAPTQATLRAANQLLDYAYTHPDAVVRFVASEMILHVDSDASYLSAPKARSRGAGYFYLSGWSVNKAKRPQHNGPILVPCHIMREVLSSAAEAELGALFHNCKEACAIRILLKELGHAQPPTIVITDNSTAAGIANDTVKQKRTKAMDMRFHWVRDRVSQLQFTIDWQSGKLNRADYFTKHHPASHHQQIRSVYLYHPADPTRNYFDCLQDDMEDPKSSTGEGVLIGNTA